MSLRDGGIRDGGPEGAQSAAEVEQVLSDPEGRIPKETKSDQSMWKAIHGHHRVRPETSKGVLSQRVDTTPNSGMVCGTKQNCLKSTTLGIHRGKEAERATEASVTRADHLPHPCPVGPRPGVKERTHQCEGALETTEAAAMARCQRQKHKQEVAATEG